MHLLYLLLFYYSTKLTPSLHIFSLHSPHPSPLLFYLCIPHSTKLTCFLQAYSSMHFSFLLPFFTSVHLSPTSTSHHIRRSTLSSFYRTLWHHDAFFFVHQAKLLAISCLITITFHFPFSPSRQTSCLTKPNHHSLYLFSYPLLQASWHVMFHYLTHSFFLIRFCSPSLSALPSN